MICLTHHLLYHEQSMGLPQAEQRDFALTAMGIQDPFCPELRPQQRLQMLEMEESATDSLFVIMSDIQLDRPLVSLTDAILRHNCDYCL
jgi:hypothetical protein